MILLKFYFVIISLKKHNLVKSCNYRSSTSKVKRSCWGGEPTTFADFWRFVTKI